MRTIKILSFVLAVVFMLITCKNEEPQVDRCGDMPFVCTYIFRAGFSDDYLEDYITNFGSGTTDSLTADYIRNDFKRWGYFIKGVITNKLDYGLTVQVLEDIKGNMTDRSFINVWGNKGAYQNERDDILTQYSVNDTLLLMLDTIYSDNGLEKAGDYKTARCTWSDGSVLRYANGFVSGYIHSLDEEIETMLWSDLKQELIDYLTGQKVLPFQEKL